MHNQIINEKLSNFPEFEFERYVAGRGSKAGARSPADQNGRAPPTPARSPLTQTARTNDDNTCTKTCTDRRHPLAEYPPATADPLSPRNEALLRLNRLP
jgi:hypothetical protein